MSKCKNCVNLRCNWCEKVSDSPDENMERECVHFRRMTNADRIRETDRALAEKLTDCTYRDGFPFASPSWVDPYGNSCLARADAVNEWLIWLQQPAEEADHG